MTHKEVKTEADVPANLWWVICEFKRYVLEQGGSEIVKVKVEYRYNQPELIFIDAKGIRGQLSFPPGEKLS